MRFSAKNNPYLYGLAALVVIIGVGGYFLYQTTNALKQSRAESLARGNDIQELEAALSNSQYENEMLAEALEAEQEKLRILEDEVRDIAGTVGDLEKLSKTDPELLQKYSKVFFLNEHYRPEKMSKIDEKFVLKTDEEEYVHQSVWPFLEDMLEDAEDDGINLRVISAFRSFDEQRSLKTGYTVVYGSGANQFSADQGYSEHQLGTTIDFSTKELGTAFANIDKTEAFIWLTKNAYKYGFILSYPPGNAYYQYEPWHWRFVGRDLARKLDREKKYFYDLDQREIDTHLLEIFD